MLSKKLPKRSGIKGEKKSQKNKDRSDPRIKEAYKHENSGRGSLLMPEYEEWVKSRPDYVDRELEWHHYFTGGGRLDCFTAVVSANIHKRIHSGDIGVQGFIDKRGERILICESMDTIQCWLNDDLTSFEMIKKYQPLVDAILDDIDNAVEIARSFNQ